jgi:hypothetical protein
MKTKIAIALEALLNEVSVLKYVAFGPVKLYSHDFHEDELPGAQFITVGEQIVHERTRAKRTWSLSLELVDKSDENGYISQRDMWNLEYQISRKIWANPNLGIPGVVHCVYLGNASDLHLIEPFYLLRMDFDVVYYEHLVSEC